MNVRLITLAVVLVCSLTLTAHHSFPSYYFEEQTVRIRGPLVEFDFRAPHAWVKLTARDDNGDEQVYAAEWSNPNRLTRDGITRDTLKIGDIVIVAGSPGRVPAEHRLHLKAIQRVEDGWEWPQDRRRR